MGKGEAAKGAPKAELAYADMEEGPWQRWPVRPEGRHLQPITCRGKSASEQFGLHGRRPCRQLLWVSSWLSVLSMKSIEPELPRLRALCLASSEAVGLGHLTSRTHRLHIFIEIPLS